MSTLFVNNLNTASGTDITIPTGKKLVATDTGGVKVPGTIVQVQTTQAHYSGITDLTTQTFAAIAGMSVTITPKFANSKILIRSQMSFWFSTDANNYFIATYFRNIGGAGATNLASTATYNGLQFFAPARQAQYNNVAMMEYLDSPNTTSSIVYQKYGRRYDATNIVRCTWSETTSYMTAMEIAQ